MLNVFYGSQFRRDLKLAKKRGKDLSKLVVIIDLLCAGTPLPPKNHEHRLAGEYAGCLECHIEPDWLLVYSYRNQGLELLLMRTGTHSDLF